MVAIGMMSGVIWGATLQGTVVIQDTAIPVKNAMVSVESRRVNTNSQGFFTMDLPESVVQVRVTANGYDPYEAFVTVADGITTHSVGLAIATVIQAPEQTVVADREALTVSQYRVDQAVVKTVANQALFSDTMTALKMLPGVGSKSGFDANLYIRGGNSYEVLGFIDNIPLDNLYFFGGGVSVFNPRLVTAVDFFPGGYSAEYGHALSGVMNVTTMDGLSQTPHGELDVSLTDMNYYQTGVIQPDRTGYMVSYRRTYYDLFIPLLVSTDSGDPVNLPYLEAIQGKLTHALNDRHTVTLASYVFNEGVSRMPIGLQLDAGTLTYANNRWIVSTQWDAILSKTGMNRFIVAYYVTDGFYNANADNSMFNSQFQTKTWMLRDDVTWQASDAHQVTVGGVYYMVNSSESLAFLLPPNPYESDSVTQNISGDTQVPREFFSGYINDNWQVTDRSTVMAGLRWDGIQTGDFSIHSYIQPRLRYTYQWTGQTTLQAYYGQYRQSPLNTVNAVVSGNRSDGAIQLVQTLADVHMEQATHYGMGFTHKATDYVTTKAEVFYKDYRDLSINTGEGSETIYQNKGVGNASGMELMIQRSAAQRYNGWATYTLSNTRRKDVDGWFSPDFDMTHMINLYGDMALTSLHHVITTVTYRTGVPYTPITEAVIDPQTGQKRYVTGGRYSKRIPDYFRWDLWFEFSASSIIFPVPFLPISDKKVVGIFPIMEGRLRFGMYNVLNTTNKIRYYWDDDANKEAFVTDFPRILIVGMTVYL